MKKQLAALLSVLLAISAAGCAGGQDTDSQPTDAASTTTTAAATSATSSADTDRETIDLSTCTDTLVIDTAGAYILTGTTDHAVMVNVSAGTVTLTLSGAVIRSGDTAGLIATGGDKLIVELADGTENSIADGGSDDIYDAAVFSTIPLEFTGNGKLTVSGNNQEGISTENADLTFQAGDYVVISADDGIGAGGDNGGTLTFNGGSFYINASGDGIDSNAGIVFNGGDIFVIGSAAGGDAGIDCDDGYVIHGGSVIALGTDMIETPLETSSQKTLAFTLETPVAEGSDVQVVNTDGAVVAQFTADQSFVTLIVSNKAITDDTYRVLIGGESISIGGESEFTANNTVNYYGTATGMPEDEPGMEPGGEPPAGG